MSDEQEPKTLAEQYKEAREALENTIADVIFEFTESTGFAVEEVTPVFHGDLIIKNNFYYSVIVKTKL